MKTKDCKLTNKDIAENFSNNKFGLMLDDFIGEFAKWVVRQDLSKSWQNQIKAIRAYEKWLKEIIFHKKDEVVFMTMKDIEKYVNDTVFTEIPAIYALNQIAGSGFVDLGALSRNIVFGIMRDQITQPLN